MSGPAFPSHGSMGEVVETGLTKREYFAALAMQALASAHDESGTWTGDDPATAEQAVILADALIAALAKAQP